MLVEGGGILSLVSGQLLNNSDFFTGAFPVEYGNALSGVFDMNLRAGNNEKRGWGLQVGTLGIDGFGEGPFIKGKKGLISFQLPVLHNRLNEGPDSGRSVAHIPGSQFQTEFPNRKGRYFLHMGDRGN